jgi:CheY-like chemotaxis protein/HPt (histidine-containing phosphotransfer) domain-containing protein
VTPRRWHALVVDDNAINREVAVELLAQLGLQTDIASNGAQAVAQARARTQTPTGGYDLIVMDVQMPVMDGVEATRHIRRAPGRRPAIIALTANADADDREACLSAGMDDYLTKPVDPQGLQDALLRWLPGWAAPAVPAAVRTPAALPPPGWASDRAAPPGQPRSGDLQQARLATIAGLDLAGSLRNLGGQAGRLERVLRRFAATYRAGEPALMQAARQGDRAALWQVCHSLRGACAVLCADALVQHIEALELTLEHTPDGAQDAAQTAEALLSKVRPLQAELVALARQLEAALAAG